jgi:hypothetical protein
MLVILASDLDETAVELTHRWARHEAVMLTPRDLSTPGWSFDPLGSTSSAVAGGERISSRDIRAVYIRRSAVFAEELVWIAAEDRHYAAAEMTAFLLAWLSSLPVPVVNAPTPTALCGPGLRPAGWRALARGMGIETAESAVGDLHDVTLVGNRVFGEPLGAAQARRLAARTGLTTGRFSFTGDVPKLVGVSPFVDVSDPAVCEALLSLFELA